LGSAKEEAQIGAVIGREFSYALLAAAARKTDAQPDWALDRLIQAGLLFRRGAVPNATYMFKHALVPRRGLWNAAARTTARLHARIFELQSQFPRSRKPAELLAIIHQAVDRTGRRPGQSGRAIARPLGIAEAWHRSAHAIEQIASLPRAGAAGRQSGWSRS
jgi:hypothetical protein